MSQLCNGMCPKTLKIWVPPSGSEPHPISCLAPTHQAGSRIQQNHSPVFGREFAYGLLVATVGSKLPPRGSCSHNSVLPYDRPLDFKMRALDGPDFVLSRFNGAAVWINLFATWCPPCNAEQPFVVASAQRYFDRGLRVIGVDFMEPDDTVRAYRKKFCITYPIAMDVNGGFTQALEVGRTDNDVVFPAHLFFTPQGYLSCYVLG